MATPQRGRCCYGRAVAVWVAMRDVQPKYTFHSSNACRTGRLGQVPADPLRIGPTAFLLQTPCKGSAVGQPDTPCHSRVLVGRRVTALTVVTARDSGGRTRMSWSCRVFGTPSIAYATAVAPLFRDGDATRCS